MAYLFLLGVAPQFSGMECIERSFSGQIACQDGQVAFIGHAAEKSMHDDAGKFLSFDAVGSGSSMVALVLMHAFHHG
ncbi:hypothetical protein OIU34_27910 [Pararhizobium sp. BT-229]|uniref:hypothetical protein n=1 Tax=Pararhizobium sp. BT-229 TaxID=2986923 RepID=UPI0021F7EFF0|nr:hypothetical protein [Pararhizobium sp. BT-229]MCV9965702.1 hypothetical protein [Pararhizobium sp. BT-229]